MERFSHLNDLHLGGIERDLAAKVFVKPETLAEALRKHGSRPIPPNVLDYVCRMLEGKVRQPPGVKPFPEIEKSQLHMLLRVIYGRNLTWLQKRKEKYGNPVGWTNLEDTPAVIAAQLVAKRYFHGVRSWRAVQNIARSRK